MIIIESWLNLYLISLTYYLSCIAIFESLSKLNETNFYLEKFNIDTNGVFVRKQELNELRRMAVQKIEEYYLSPKPYYFNMKELEEKGIVKASAIKPIKELENTYILFNVPKIKTVFSIFSSNL